jgi:hypothetical protein
MVAEAFISLSWNASDHWDADKQIPQAILAFLHELTGTCLNDKKLLEFKTNLETSPVDKIFIAEWFHNIYSELGL